MSIEIKGDINKLPNVRKKAGVKDEDIKRIPNRARIAKKDDIIEKDELIAKLQKEVASLRAEIASYNLKDKKAAWVRWRLGVPNGR